MSHGLPVITSDAKPAARIVREVGCGEVFVSDDYEDFAHALRKLANSETRAQMSRNGRQAVLTQYNWETDERKLLRAIETAVSRHL